MFDWPRSGTSARGRPEENRGCDLRTTRRSHCVGQQKTRALSRSIIWWLALGISGAWTAAAGDGRRELRYQFGRLFVARTLLADEPVTNPSMIVADSLDRFFLSDRGPARIVVFSGNGRVIRQIGREGRGSGEYVAPSIGVNAKMLIVHDAQLRRLSAFSSEGRLLWTRSGTCCGLHKVGVDRMSRIYVLSRPLVLGVEVPLATLIVFDSLGTLIDSASVPNAVPGRQSQWSRTSSEAAIAVPVPYTPAPHFTVTGAGSVVFGYSNDYAVYAGKNARDGRVVVRRTWTPATLGDDLRQRAVDALVDEFGPIIGRKQAIDLFKTEDVPKTGQAFYGLDVDACGRLWVLRSPPEQETASFDVYDSQFNYLDQLTVARRLLAPPRFAIGRNVLGAIVEDDQGAPQAAFVPFSLKGHGIC